MPGMEYLSGSAIKYHGRLSSTNCVIDSRFMLKLTDFGIPAVFAMDELYLKGNVNNNKYLWTAPEILRITKNRQDIKPHVRQMADIYSFGIILQEIIIRGAPFEGYDFTAAEILNRLTAAPGLAGPFRPIINNSQCAPELIHLMKDCWAEDPEERPPSFNAIASSLRKINTFIWKKL
ncbi:hypothetical protein KUTeg_019454 [Tegillarca granosa]|uniref:guanylate cyclase n=1 Tax=Tegillarca granosa TaxID=220873 RepID=A0ABQ9EIJ5_TEGGR|nr:hypothetical protein KUTeg_019454 [Tegillarca granosa]